MFRKFWYWLKRSFRYWFGTRSQVEEVSDLAFDPFNRLLTASDLIQSMSDR